MYEMVLQGAKRVCMRTKLCCNDVKRICMRTKSCCKAQQVFARIRNRIARRNECLHAHEIVLHPCNCISNLRTIITRSSEPSGDHIIKKIYK